MGMSVSEILAWVGEMVEVLGLDKWLQAAVVLGLVAFIYNKFFNKS